MTNLPEKLGAFYYRGSLSQQGKEFYDRINAQLLSGDYSGVTAFTVNCPNTASSDCFAAYKAIRDDHPEYFYLGFQSEFTLCGHRGTLRYPILYPSNIIARVQRQLRKTIYRIVCGTAELQMTEREQLVYERIARRLSYADHNDVRDHNIVGTVLTSSGVCEGHNALLMLCFRRVGIPCIKVYGKTKRDRWHCWTIAWINGIPVHCDVTWEDAEYGMVCFDYVNLSDESISADHFCFKGLNVPICSSDKLNYYTLNGLCVYSFADLRRLIRARNSQIKPLLIHFGYKPAFGSCISETKRAISAENIVGDHLLFYRPEFNNLIVDKLT